MPELPEVETIARELDQVLPGKKITGVEIRREKSFVGDPKELVGMVVDEVGRKAKMTVVRFRNSDKVLVIHLKMTGQLIYVENSRRIVGGHPTPDWVNKLPSNSTRVVIEFDNGAKLFFNDLRVFGWLKLMVNSEWQMAYGGMPPDVTDKEFSLEYFKGILKKSGRATKLVLLDQGKFGGVGNIYANDALYLARIDPRRKANELSTSQVEDLYEAVKEVIALGIKYGGASVDKYVDAAGVGGKYQEHFQIYQRDGEKCKRDDETIKKIKIGARGTYYCPGCQK
jgi:formamidopyrimidine-DNA glycosylase